MHLAHTSRSAHKELQKTFNVKGAYTVACSLPSSLQSLCHDRLSTPTFAFHSLTLCFETGHDEPKERSRSRSRDRDRDRGKMDSCCRQPHSHCFVIKTTLLVVTRVWRVLMRWGCAHSRRARRWWFAVVAVCWDCLLLRAGVMLCVDCSLRSGLLLLLLSVG